MIEFEGANLMAVDTHVFRVSHSIAAGMAMIFATAIAFAFQQKYGNFTMPLFIALFLVRAFVENTILITSKYRELRRIINAPTVQKDLMRYYF